MALSDCSNTASLTRRETAIFPARGGAGTVAEESLASSSPPERDSSVVRGPVSSGLRMPSGRGVNLADCSCYEYGIPCIYEALRGEHMCPFRHRPQVLERVAASIPQSLASYCTEWCRTKFTDTTGVAASSNLPHDTYCSTGLACVFAHPEMHLVALTDCPSWLAASLPQPASRRRRVSRLGAPPATGRPPRAQGEDDSGSSSPFAICGGGSGCLLRHSTVLRGMLRGGTAVRVCPLWCASNLPCPRGSDCPDMHTMAKQSSAARLQAFKLLGDLCMNRHSAAGPERERGSVACSASNSTACFGSEGAGTRYDGAFSVASGSMHAATVTSVVAPSISPLEYGALPIWNSSRALLLNWIQQQAHQSCSTSASARHTQALPRGWQWIEALASCKEAWFKSVVKDVRKSLGAGELPLTSAPLREYTSLSAFTYLARVGCVEWDDEVGIVSVLGVPITHASLSAPEVPPLSHTLVSGAAAPEWPSAPLPARIQRSLSVSTTLSMASSACADMRLADSRVVAEDLLALHQEKIMAWIHSKLAPGVHDVKTPPRTGSDWLSSLAFAPSPLQGNSPHIGIKRRKSTPQAVEAALQISAIIFQQLAASDFIAWSEKAGVTSANAPAAATIAPKPLSRTCLASVAVAGADICSASAETSVHAPLITFDVCVDSASARAAPIIPTNTTALVVPAEKFPQAETKRLIAEAVLELSHKQVRALCVAHAPVVRAAAVLHPTAVPTPSAAVAELLCQAPFFRKSCRVVTPPECPKLQSHDYFGIAKCCVSRLMLRGDLEDGFDTVRAPSSELCGRTPRSTSTDSGSESLRCAELAVEVVGTATDSLQMPDIVVYAAVRDVIRAQKARIQTVLAGLHDTATVPAVVQSSADRLHGWASYLLARPELTFAPLAEVIKAHAASACAIKCARMEAVLALLGDADVGPYLHTGTRVGADATSVLPAAITWIESGAVVSHVTVSGSACPPSPSCLPMPMATFSAIGRLLSDGSYENYESVVPCEVPNTINAGTSVSAQPVHVVQGSEAADDQTYLPPAPLTACCVSKITSTSTAVTGSAHALAAAPALSVVEDDSISDEADSTEEPDMLHCATSDGLDSNEVSDSDGCDSPGDQTAVDTGVDADVAGISSLLGRLAFGVSASGARGETRLEADRAAPLLLPSSLLLHEREGDVPSMCYVYWDIENCQCSVKLSPMHFVRNALAEKLLAAGIVDADTEIDITVALNPYSRRLSADMVGSLQVPAMYAKSLLAKECSLPSISARSLAAESAADGADIMLDKELVLQTRRFAKLFRPGVVRAVVIISGDHWAVDTIKAIHPTLVAQSIQLVHVRGPATHLSFDALYSSHVNLVLRWREDVLGVATTSSSTQFTDSSSGTSTGNRGRGRLGAGVT